MHTTTRSALAGAALALAGALALAQPTSDSPLADRPNGPRSATPTHHVLYNATVHPRPGTVWAPGFVEIRDGVIIDAGPIGKRIYTPPEGARAHDLTGEYIYAAFIDPWVEVDAPNPMDKSEGLHWNEKVMPHRRALAGEGLTKADRERLRDLGFAAAGIAPDDSVIAGLGAVVSTDDPASDASTVRPRAYRDAAFNTFHFETVGWGRRGYPTSHPGAVALIRQTLSDADWQRGNQPEAPNALTPLEDRSRPLMFRAADPLEHFLAADIAREFDRPLVTVGNGMEFKWLDALKREAQANSFSVVLPLRFPRQPDVSTVGKAEDIELEAMLEWEHAPANPARIVGAGITAALTTSELPKGQKFFDNLRKAIDAGLSEKDALAMLTTLPAEILGVSGTLGTIEEGKAANILVTSAPVFDKDAKRHDLFINGRHHRLADRKGIDFDGDWTLVVGPRNSPTFTMTFEVTGSAEGKAKIKVTEGPTTEGEDASTNDARKVEIQGNRISFLVDDDDANTEDGSGVYIMSGALNPDGTLRGTGINPSTEPFQWTATRDEAVADAKEDDADKKDDDTKTAEIPDLPGYPFGPYAVAELPDQQSVVYTNATLWTSGPQGIVENGTLIISGGKIQYAGPARGAPARPRGATVINAEGKHITPGLVDAHSHTSLFRFGVNEAGQAITAEVRIGDSLDPSAINWYRQLAMGVTTVLSLHGSANPIGGQSQTHKVRWGARHPHDMRMEGAKPGIKFALGENVKQSNWGDDYTSRYPQTRMGVETIIRDRFTAAQEYMRRMADAGVPLGEHARADAATEPRSHEATEVGNDARTFGENLPGPDRVAESDGSRASGIHRDEGSAEGRDLRALATDASRSGLGTVEHRGGARPTQPAGRPQVPQDRTRLAGGTQNTVRAGDHDAPDATTPTDRVAARRDGSSPASPDPLPRETLNHTPSWLRGSVASWLASSTSSLRRSVAPSLSPPRRDLELEAIAEILRGDRLVHCHSYRQDEILMLCRVAEDFGFTIGTFQHGLEVYKVAEVVQKHAIGASIFSDWWAFKYEVVDAIPGAGPLQAEAGVLSSYNSDSDELARRMNLEAAKATRYSHGFASGDPTIDAENALRFVTINPAIQLGIGDRIGSLEAGKDADFVVWSGDPMSVYTMCEETWIDGRQYFSLEQDAQHRERTRAERQRLIQKILANPKKDADKDDETESAPNETEGSEGIDSPPSRRAILADYMLNKLRSGHHPDAPRPGDCGCGIINHAIYYQMNNR